MEGVGRWRPGDWDRVLAAGEVKKGSVLSIRSEPLLKVP
jgi:hypothetical protein